MFASSKGKECQKVVDSFDIDTSALVEHTVKKTTTLFGGTLQPLLNIPSHTPIVSYFCTIDEGS